VAGDEHEAQEVVADVIVERALEVGRRELALDLEVLPQLLALLREALRPGGSDRWRGAWRRP
jgi:hypothetical protein